MAPGDEQQFPAEVGGTVFTLCWSRPMELEKHQRIARERRPDVPQVLIADDDPSCLAMLEGAFRRRGWVTITCTEGRQAWEGIQERPGLSMAILNWMLPDLDGYRICRQVCEQERAVVTVLMIGRTFLSEARRRLDLRANYMLTKPLAQTEIDLQIGVMVHQAFRRHAARGFQYAPTVDSGQLSEWIVLLKRPPGD